MLFSFLGSWLHHSNFCFQCCTAFSYFILSVPFSPRWQCYCQYNILKNLTWGAQSGSPALLASSAVLDDSPLSQPSVLPHRGWPSDSSSQKNRALAPGLALGQAEVVLAGTTSPLETLEGRAKIVDLDHMAMAKSTCCRQNQDRDRTLGYGSSQQLSVVYG